MQYNVKDAAGKILLSESQVESFSRGGQLLVLGTQVSVPPGSKATTVDAALVVKPDGIGQELKVGPVAVGKDEFDSGGKIIGGTSEFPDLPPSGAARVDTSGLIVSGTPTKCEAYAGGV